MRLLHGDLKGQFSRKRTNNEQLRVRCCGIILDMATFFVSEGIATVVVS